MSDPFSESLLITFRRYLFNVFRRHRKKAGCAADRAVLSLRIEAQLNFITAKGKYTPILKKEETKKENVLCLGFLLEERARAVLNLGTFS